MEATIRNTHELDELETRIATAMGRLDFDTVLLGVRQAQDRLIPFSTAGIALFAARYSRPPIVRGQFEGLSWEQLAPIAHLITQYLLADPVSFEPPIEDSYHGSTIIPVLMRLIGNQALYALEPFGQYSRTLILFDELPRQLAGRTEIPEFDFGSKFHALSGVSLIDFIVVGLIAYFAALSNVGFTAGYFQKALSQGIKLPDLPIVHKVLDQLAADQYQIREMYEQYKQPDRRYRAYDYNPLVVYPLWRPWRKWADVSIDEDRMVAPIPNLIVTRIGEGIYHQMFHSYRDTFPEWFGHIFEAYVGQVLERCIACTQLMSERELRQTYKSQQGKVPDWIILDGDTAILIECKATGFSRKALATADETTIDYSLNRVVDGLTQLSEFREACERREAGLERLNCCSTFRTLVITFEHMFLVNSLPFREIIWPRLSERLSTKGIKPSPWVVLSIGQLENLQVHLSAGIRMATFLKKVDSMMLDKAFEEIQNETKRTYEHSFLHEKDKEIHSLLGAPR
jgi:hypothetical protein